MRKSGILMHISSLPSPYGIGTLGKAAYDFADFLHSARQHYWQILPLGPTSYGDSPYQSFSTRAGNPYFIDLDLLQEEGLLTREELEEIPWEAHSQRVDYGFQYSVRFPLLKKAYVRGRDRFRGEMEAFRRENTWVEDYTLFMAVKTARNMECWAQWPEDIRLRRPGAREHYASDLREEVDYFLFLQFMFFRQWKALRDYCRSLDLEIIGDLPIYVPYDSCDVWAEPELFQLWEDGTPRAVAGCPPDAFTADGQLWGNPLYDWDRMASDRYWWWRRRIEGASQLFDVIRIDHFRGLESYWSVPYGDTTARNGRWVKGPGHDFISTLREFFPHLRLIAEDLGFLTEEVVKLQKDSGFPGMKILEFAFDPREPSSYLPHRYEKNCICYTGTHDNEPLAQWLAGISRETQVYLMDYLGIERRRNCCRAMIRAGLGSVADTFIAQIQDYLELGEGSRMNEPGSCTGKNWTWRLPEGLLTEELAADIGRLTRLYGRG